MVTIQQPLRTLNIELLDATLRQVFGTIYGGLSTTPRHVKLHFTDGITGEQRRQAIHLLNQHDATQRTDQQKATQFVSDALQQARQSQPHLLDLTDYDFSDTILRNLAHKIIWLELEIRQLRQIAPTDYPTDPIDFDLL